MERRDEILIDYFLQKSFVARIVLLCVYSCTRGEEQAGDGRRGGVTREEWPERKIVGGKKEKIRGEKREEKARTRRDEA